jgi:hypothetical protein
MLIKERGVRMNARLQLFLAAVVLAVVLLTARPPGASAQYLVKNGTLVSAGGVGGNGSYIVYNTVGEPVIGIAAGASNAVKTGFWYAAGVTSTVDVAITSFFAELADETIVLTWGVSASSSFEGFNVYRSPADAEAFERLNGALVPASTAGSYRDDTALPGHAYQYRLGAVSKEGELSSQTISIALPPKPTTLYQNYPNPFNPTTSIAFYLPARASVMLAIYDVRGARVRLLAADTRPEGRHIVQWDGKNDAGVRVGSGVYYYRLEAGKESFTKKLVVVR